MALTQSEIKEISEKAEVLNDLNIVEFITMIKERFEQYTKELQHGS